MVIAAFILTKGSSQGKIENLDGLSYTWESEDAASFGLKSSTIEFYNDSIKIIKIPEDVAGLLSFESGTCRASENDDGFMCVIDKAVVFSMNIGRVISYCEDSMRTIEVINVKRDSITIRLPELAEVNMDEPYRHLPSQYVYLRTITSNSDTNRKWINFLETFDNKDKRVNCRF